MMSAKVQAVLASGSGTTAEALARTSSTSICRLGKVASDLKNPQDIYATVKAVSYAGKKDEPSTQEYRNSEAVSSNVANSMYADGTKDGNVKIAAFRHLSNIRYYDESNTAEFALTSRNLTGHRSAQDFMILSWRQRRGAVRDRSSPGRKTAKKKRWISRRSPSSLPDTPFRKRNTDPDSQI